MVLLWILHRDPVFPSTESVVLGGDAEFPSSARMFFLAVPICGAVVNPSNDTVISSCGAMILPMVTWFLEVML